MRNSPSSAARQAGDWHEPQDEAAWLELLAQGDVLDCQPLPWGSNYAFALLLRDGRHQALAVYKPRRGEAPLWDFPAGTLYRREYAAFLLSQLLGWAFVPPTVVRNGPHDVGVVQRYIEPVADYRGLGAEHDDELRRIALFDLVTNNADRKSGHCLKDRDGRIWSIDHGLTFHTAPKLRTVLWEYCGQHFPQPALEDLRRLHARADELRAAFAPWLTRAEIDACLQRIERLLERPRFPQLDSRRNVPYEFW